MQPPGKGSDVEIHQVGKDFQGGVYEVTASTNSGLQELESKLAERSYDARFDSLTAITLATQQQILLFRRKIRLLTLLFVLAFLTAVASLVLTVMITISVKTFSLNQPTSAPGRLSGR